MNKIKKVDRETLKNLNKQIILNYIHKYKEISRIDLALKTKLSPTTVSSITSELIKSKIVNEIRIGESSGGRKPVMLGIMPDAGYAISIILSQKDVKYALVNLNYEIIEFNCLRRKTNGEEEVIDVIIKCIEELKNKYSFCMEKVNGIGISIPGVISNEDGKILYSSKLNLKDIDILAKIKKITGFDCNLYKDTDALILGEYKFGIGRSYDNLVYIVVENGVGMSYIYSGKLFKPGYGGGFELGHITIDSNGPVCSCGNRGCLGTMVSEAAIVSRLQKLIEKGFKTEIKDVSILYLSDIVELSNLGDKAARYVLEEQARLLGIAVSSIVNILNPQLIVIGGPLSKCKWDFLELLSDVVRDRSLEIYSKNVKIKFAELGNDSALMGMANDIFEKKIFKPVEL